MPGFKRVVGAAIALLGLICLLYTIEKKLVVRSSHYASVETKDKGASSQGSFGRRLASPRGFFLRRVKTLVRQWIKTKAPSTRASPVSVPIVTSVPTRAPNVSLPPPISVPVTLALSPIPIILESIPTPLPPDLVPTPSPRAVNPVPLPPTDQPLAPMLAPFPLLQTPVASPRGSSDGVLAPFIRPDSLGLAPMVQSPVRSPQRAAVHSPQPRTYATAFPTYYNHQESLYPSFSAEPTTVTIPPSVVRATILQSATLEPSTSAVLAEQPIGATFCKPASKCPGRNLMHDATRRRCVTACIHQIHVDQRRKAGWTCGACTRDHLPPSVTPTTSSPSPTPPTQVPMAPTTAPRTVPVVTVPPSVPVAVPVPPSVPVAVTVPRTMPVTAVPLPTPVVAPPVTPPVDVTPPELRGLSMRPSSGIINATEPLARVDFGLTVSEFGSGYRDVYMILAFNQSETYIARSGVTFGAGGGVTGSFTVTIALSVGPDSWRGRYNLSVVLQDAALNNATFSTAELVARGFPSYFTVVGV